MQPVTRDLAIYRGDNLDVLIRLWAMVDDALEPLDVTGLTWTLTAGSIVKTTGNDSLDLDITSERVRLLWQATPTETNAIENGAIYSLVRTGGPRGRRTYLTGRIIVHDKPFAGQGDIALDLSVTDGDLVLDVTVNDTYAENILTVVREEIAEVDRRAFTYALIFG